jgi:hypothetical protein
MASWRHQMRGPKVLRHLKVTEGSLVRAAANKHATISLFKGERGDRRMSVQDVPDRISKADASYDLERHLAALEPDLSYGEALTKRWNDADVRALYEAHAEAAPDRAPCSAVRNAMLGDSVWDEIQREAGGLVEASAGAVTLAEACEQCTTPERYRQYVREQRQMLATGDE